MSNETPPTRGQRLTLQELLDSLPSELRPPIIWGQIVSKLPDSLGELREQLQSEWAGGPTEQEMTSEFVAMIAASEDPDAIVRQLPYSEGTVDGKPTLWVHFVLPPLND